MSRKVKTLPLMAFVFVVVLYICAYSVPAFDVVTIVGEVNDSNQIVGEVNDSNQIVVEGEIYEVDDTPKGDDLVKNYVGQKVKVTGKLRLEGDMRILEVTQFGLVKEIL